MKSWIAAFVVALVVAFGLGQLLAQTRTRAEDCVPYNPALLQLMEEGDRSWLISGNGARFIGTDTKEDADVMMTVFKAHKALCYVGRNNKRANRMDYVHMYWK